MLPALLLIALGPQVADVDQAFAKYKEWKKGAVAFRSVQKFRSNPGAWGKSTLLIANGDLRLTAEFAGHKYEAAIRKGNLVEVDGESGLYDGMEVRPGSLMWESRLSDLSSNAHPYEILAADLKAMLPQGTKYSFAKEGGNSVITATVSGMASGTVRFVLSPAGQPVKMLTDIRSQSGRIYRDFEFESIEANPKLDATSFVLKEPSDYAPYASPEPQPAIEGGEKMDLSRWLGKDGKPASLGGKATLLYGHLENDSQRKLLESMLQTLRLPRLRLGGPKDRAADIRAKDASTWKALMQGGSPIVLLVDAKGILDSAWLGLSPKIANERRTEIAKAIQDLPK